MKKAYFIGYVDGFSGEARLYRLSEPAEYYCVDEGKVLHCDYVVVSAIVGPWFGVETYIFPADKDGKVLSWGEMDGSCRGVWDHELVLRKAGYEVVSHLESEE